MKWGPQLWRLCSAVLAAAGVCKRVSSRPHPLASHRPAASRRKLEKNAEGEEVERRFVKYGAGGIDPTALPAEWHQ